MTKLQQSMGRRLAADAGIAIGPILFIIAILAILAAAIAAGSGSFTAGTSNESNSTKASAVIEIGENLKIGFDRVTMDNDIAPNNVSIGLTNTTTTNELFSPVGGGITLPSVALANIPGTDVWEYVYAGLPNMGTSAEERLAMLEVSQGVCDQINVKADALDPTVANYDVGAIGDPAGANNDLGSATSTWPTKLVGKPIGCVYSSSDSKYWFYETLAVQ